MNHISSCIEKIHKGLQSDLERSNLFSFTPLETPNNETDSFGKVSMNICALESSYTAQGRLSSFHMSGKMAGMMFYLLPSAESYGYTMGTDIMSSRKALSLVCIELDQAFGMDEFHNDHLSSLRARILENAAPRKKPINFKNTMTDDTIIVGVKKDREEIVSNIISKHHTQAVNNFI